MIFALVVAIFAIANMKPVTLNFLFTKAEVPLVLVIISSALLGGLVVWAFSVFFQLKMRLQLKRTEKELKELKQLQAGQAQEIDPQRRIAPMNTRVIQVANEEEFQQALAIRREVFIEEQEVPEDLEIDELEQVATHVLAYDDTGKPVATGRIIPYEGGKAGKMQRIAVLKNARTGGYGRVIMNKLEAIGRELGYTKFVLEAQTHAEGFYRKLGYVTVSDEPFLEAGIWHVKMEKPANG